MELSSRRLLYQSTPGQRGQLHGLSAFPGLTVDHFRLVQAIDRLGQGVVVGITHTAHRGLDTSLGQALRVADRPLSL